METIKNLIRYYWRTEKKLYLRLYLGLVAIFLLMHLILFFFCRIFSPDEIGGILRIFNDEWVFWGFILICTARMFVALEKKQTTITLLSLPASNRAKFLTRVIYATIGIYLLALAARCTVNLIHCIPLFFDENWPLEYILRYKLFPGTWVINSVFYHGPRTLWEIISIIAFASLFALWPWSLFTLFGVLFRRNGWLWAIPVLFVGVSVFAIFARICSLSDKTLLTISFVIILAFSLLNYWLAYRCFCRAQVISTQTTRL